MKRGMILTGLAALAVSGAALAGSINTKQGITADGDIATKGDVTAQGQLVSNVRTGTPPIQVSSTTRVDKLNAQYLDGMAAGDFAGVTELATAGGGVSVHWKNIAGIPGEEIDQECAVNTGCFTGDTPGFPVTITEPGSYRLASNLDVRGETNPEDVTAIEVQTSNVTLDLAGFGIMGPVTCSGTPVTSCSAFFATGDGINAKWHDNITITGGWVQGAGRWGIACSNCLVEKVTASQNGISGFSAQHTTGSSAVSSVFRGVVATRNGAAGIAGHGIIENSATHGNKNMGILGSSGANVVGNRSSDNGGAGIEGGRNTRISGNTSINNAGDGIECPGGQCFLINNFISGNGGYGISVTNNDGAYSGNVIYTNNNQTVSGPIVDLGGNLCDSGVCP